MQVLLRIALFLLLLSPAAGRCELAFDFNVSPHPSNGPPTRGQASTWTFTITNTGDQPITLARVGAEYVEEGPGRTLYVLANASTAPCGVQYTDFSGPELVIVVAEILIEPTPINPGESRSCAVDLLFDEDAPGFFTQGFLFLANSGPLSATQSTSLSFQLDPSAVPVPGLSFFQLAALALLLVVVGVFTLARADVERSRAKAIDS